MIYVANLFSWDWRLNTAGKRLSKRVCLLLPVKYFDIDIFGNGLDALDAGIFNAGDLQQFIFFGLSPEILHGRVAIVILTARHRNCHIEQIEQFLNSWAQYWLPQSERWIHPRAGRHSLSQ
jgi:hypothetical protein